MAIPIPPLSAEAIHEAAENLLNAHQVERAIPVEIEEIIEFGLGIEMRPIKALNARFGFEGALSHNLTVILIDDDSSKRNLNRYRFTLAHELGHYVLHSDFIASMSFQDKEDWKSTVNAIAPQTYGRLEYQAYTFAGHVLVPTAALRVSCQEAQTEALRHGIDLSEMGEGAISYVAAWIAKEYRVSTAVIERRVNNEAILFNGE